MGLALAGGVAPAPSMPIYVFIHAVQVVFKSTVNVESWLIVDRKDITVIDRVLVGVPK